MSLTIKPSKTSAKKQLQAQLQELQHELHTEFANSLIHGIINNLSDEPPIQVALTVSDQPIKISINTYDLALEEELEKYEHLQEVIRNTASILVQSLSGPATCPNDKPKTAPKPKAHKPNEGASTSTQPKPAKRNPKQTPRESKTISEDACFARVWNAGCGGRCSAKRTQGDYCKTHFKQAVQLKLTNGDVRVEGTGSTPRNPPLAKKLYGDLQPLTFPPDFPLNCCGILWLECDEDLE